MVTSVLGRREFVAAASGLECPTSASPVRLLPKGEASWESEMPTMGQKSNSKPTNQVPHIFVRWYICS